MKPIPFNGQTLVLRKPNDMTDEQCGPLPILRLDGVCISCWRPSFWEAVKVLCTRRVWLGVHSGQTQPPVYIAAHRPFEFSPAVGDRWESRPKAAA